MATFAEKIALDETKVAAKRSYIAGIKSEREALLAPLAATDSLDEASQARFDSLTDLKRSAEAELVTLEATVAELRKESDEDDKATRAAAESVTVVEHRSPTLVTKQERTYNKGNTDTFAADLMRFSFGQASGETAERLTKHENEARAAGQYSTRAASTSTFQGIIPPQYLIDQYALVARAGRPIANVVQHFDLPEDGMSLIIPRSTTGVTTAIQTAENAALTTTDQVWANVTVPVVTIGAYNDVSRQSIDRGNGVDQIVFNDLAAAYAVNLDQQVISGTGSAGQMLGILNTSGTNQATAFTAAATAGSFYLKSAGQLSAIETTRYLAPNIIAMHPRRWNWLLGQVDSQGRPLAVPNMNGPFNALSVSEAPIDTPSSSPVGWFLGLPVITDASLPTAVGTGPEDQVIVFRKEDLLLWEDPAAPFQLRFEQTVGTNLTVRLVAYGYAAFTAGRFPTAVGVIGGNSASTFGLVAPTF